MKSLTRRLRRYQPGDRVVHHPTNRPGLVVTTLPHGQYYVATTAPGRTRYATGSVVPTRELRHEADLAP